jgi:hypothetical protein
MEIFAPMLTCGKVDSTGPLCLMVPSHLFDATSNVRGTETIIHGMQCTNLNLQIDIFDVWGIDFMGPFLTQKAANTSWLPSTTSLNGWKLFLARLLMLCTHRRCSMKSSS